MKFKRLLGIALGAFAFTMVSCSAKEEITFTVGAPNGAPAIALAEVAGTKGEDNNYSLSSNFEFVDAEAIGSVLSKGEKDLVVAPINAGAKLYKAGKSKYKLAAVVTWGNLAFASQKENFTLNDIDGNDLILFGQGTINESIAQYVLREKNITPSSISYKTSAADTQAELLKDNSNVIVLCAEPAVTAAKIKKNNITSINVNTLYKEVTGKDGFTQAGLFVNPNAIEQHKDALNKYIKDIKASTNASKDKLDEVAKICADLKILPNVNVAKNAIPLCSVKFEKASDVKTDIEFTANIDITQFGGAVPADDFYYNEF